MHQHHLYRGHRASSFSAIDLIELNELRARQRTFDGAYRRTALACLGYALTVLRLFDVRFYKIGILYLVLAILLFILSYVRARHSRHDFADRSSEKLSTLYKQAIPTVGQEDAREFGRPFVTAGFDVALIAVVVFAVEIAILALIIEL
ncbi:hypothetical protein F5J12DRAFT_224405 [Pisolithus orientalis]|uniref:uncharacterized protein n=1 Tax=Pisolithus orientalis TaxID=936130 RepID=UPI0022247863|nr:uncharacterized protein F5J12DRAFT_224405 [Pisolithus orientalis]KAI6002231.1 hypothetical protein F5J12DRAFT_224405 [Pisolithus orientalis]KAI6147827.1 hypothetical protein BKA82DRAFT_504500 [Pisolithus tinctorius]